MIFDPTKPVQTRDGRPAKILCIDLKHHRYQIAARVQMHHNARDETVVLFDKNGRKNYDNGEDESIDLVNVPEKHVRWVNIYKEKNGETFFVSVFHAIQNSQQSKKYHIV
jgi:Zn-dependent alcohol dehydrogenase